MSRHRDEDRTLESGRNGDADALLRAVEELRALDVEKRRAPRTGARFHEIARRIEVKAREVFRMAEAGEDPQPDEATHAGPNAGGSHRRGQN